MDTVVATIRRFVVGKKLFDADKDHFHHRLLGMGFSQRKAVFILYGCTIVMCFCAITLVFLQDASIAVLLVLLFLGGLIGIYHLGYIEYVSGERLLRWKAGILDELGFARKRRLLHSHQMLILKSKTLEDFWEKTIDAMKSLGIDYARLQLWDGEMDPSHVFERYWHQGENTKDVSVLYQYNRLYLRFPFEKNGMYFGGLSISKEAFDSHDSRYLTFSHIEHLRRIMSDKLCLLKKEGKLNQGVIRKGF
jgi:UDP-GlcNAc:undecaprenyl-phosphate GlcNAc-1-phosphate transferase